MSETFVEGAALERANGCQSICHRIPLSNPCSTESLDKRRLFQIGTRAYINHH